MAKPPRAALLMNFSVSIRAGRLRCTCKGKGSSSAKLYWLHAPSRALVDRRAVPEVNSKWLVTPEAQLLTIARMMGASASNGIFAAVTTMSNDPTRASSAGKLSRLAKTAA